MVNVGEICEIYKCGICGNIVEVIKVGGGELVCCGAPMDLLEAKTEGEGSPKHVPVITDNGDEIIVELGEIPHPMEDEHYIQFIELSIGDSKFKQFLNPGDEPKAVFKIDSREDDAKVLARAYCNIHGLWASN